MQPVPAAIDPLTAQVLVEPTEDLTLPNGRNTVVVRVNRESAQKYRLYGLTPFKNRIYSLRRSDHAMIFFRKKDHEPDLVLSTMRHFCTFFIGFDPDFDRCFAVVEEASASVDRYAGREHGQALHDALFDDVTAGESSDPEDGEKTSETFQEPQSHPALKSEE